MKSVIIGAGTYGEVYLAYLQEAGVEVAYCPLGNNKLRVKFLTMSKEYKDYVMISMNVNVAHHNVLEETGLHELGEDCLIGVGAVVIRDVEPRVVMAGVPAKVLKYKELSGGGGDKRVVSSGLVTSNRSYQNAA